MNLVPHTHVCKAGLSGMRFSEACGLVRVASGVVESNLVVKQVAPIPHVISSSARHIPFQLHVGSPIPPWDVQ